MDRYWIKHESYDTNFKIMICQEYLESLSKELAPVKDNC